MNSNRKVNKRQGSALLVCTLAAVVLSMAAIAILRSTRRSIARVDSLRATCQGRCVADGLVQRSIAILRSNPGASGSVVDPGGTMPGARSDLRPLSVNATRIQVFLYAGSTVPAKDIVVDPTAL